MRPIEESKSWLKGDGYKAASWSYDQSEPPPIYLPPSFYKKFYAVIDNAGYPYDLMSEEYPDVFVDLLSNPQDTRYDLNG